jgi:hypothetical protein
MVNTRSSDAHKTRSMGPAPTVVDVKTPLSPKRTKSNSGVSGPWRNHKHLIIVATKP